MGWKLANLVMIVQLMTFGKFHNWDGGTILMTTVMLR
jgi:hypothetical protein